MHAKQMQALDVVPESPPTSRRRSAAIPAGWSAVPQRRRRHRRRRARLGARHDRGRRRRAARRGHEDRRARHQVLPSFPARRGPRRVGAHAAVVVLEKAFAVGIGGIVGQNVRLALAGLGVVVHDVVAGLGGRAITKRSLHGLFADALARRARAGAARRSSTSTASWSSASCSGRVRSAARARTRRTSCATSASSPAAAHTEEPSMPLQPIKFYQVGSFAVGQPPARSGASGSVQAASSGRTRSPPGTAPARAAARRSARATRSTRPCARRTGSLIAANATGCLEVFSTPVPGDAPGSCRGCTRCSGTRRRSPPASPRRSRRRAATTSA